MRPVVKQIIWQKWPQHQGDLNYYEVNISNGSGILDPQFEIVRIEVMSTDLACRGGRAKPLGGPLGGGRLRLGLGF